MRSEVSILKAIAQGEMRELLIGKRGYAIPNPYLDTPTEPMQVFKAYITTFGDDTARMKEFAELVLALSKDSEYSWFSLYYLMDILDNPSLFGPEFDLESLVREVLGNVKLQKESLRQLKQWVGAQDPEGCWGFVVRFMVQLKSYENAHLKFDW